jgi:hypothetical protein
VHSGAHHPDAATCRAVRVDLPTRRLQSAERRDVRVLADRMIYLERVYDRSKILE